MLGLKRSHYAPKLTLTQPVTKIASDRNRHSAQFLKIGFARNRCNS